MQKKKKNLLIAAILLTGISSITIGSILGTQLSHHLNNDATGLNANSATTGIDNHDANSRSIKSNDTFSKSKILTPILFANQNGNYIKINDNQVSFESNAQYYLNPNLSSALNQPITFIWYGSQDDYNYGGIQIGTSSSITNSGYFQLSQNILSNYQYFYFVAQVKNNGTIIKSRTSQVLHLEITNPITINSFNIQLNGKTITSLPNQYQLNSSDNFDLVVNANIPATATSTSYTWYASTINSSNLNQLQDANDAIKLGVSTNNSFLLNQDIINAKFINFFVKVNAIINNQTYSKISQTTLSYSGNNAISSATISSSSSTIYVGQQDNYPLLTLNYTVTNALQGKNYIIKFYGENPYVNGVATTGNYLIATKTGMTSSTSINDTIQLQLNIDNAFYSKYYAIIKIGNYLYVTNAISQTIQQTYTSSNNNTPSIVNNNQNQKKTSSSVNSQKKQVIQKLNNAVDYIKNNQSSLFAYLLANNCVAFDNGTPIYQANFVATIETWLKNNKQLNKASIVNNDGTINATINGLTSPNSYLFSFNDYFQFIQNEINKIVDFVSSLNQQANLTNWLINNKSLQKIDHQYQLSNLASYLNSIKSLAKYPNSINLNYTNENWSFSNVTTTANQISFMFNYLGVNSKAITITMAQLNKCIANGAITYMQNHQNEIIDDAMSYDWGSTDDSPLVFNSSFPVTLKLWLDNHFFQAPYSFNIVPVTIGPKIYVSVGKQSANTYFTFPYRKLIMLIQNMLSSLTTFTNDLNNTPNSILNWLLATNNITYEHNIWEVTNVGGYFKQTLVQNLIPDLKANPEYENLYSSIYLFFNSNWFLNITNESWSTNTLSFSYSFYGIPSITQVTIPLPNNTLTNQSAANNVINYINQNQSSFLNMLIQDGLVTYQNDQVQFASNFNLAVAGWISANYNPFLNLDIINNDGIITAQVNSTTSTNIYSFPVSLYQSKLQVIANALAQTVDNNSNSFANWVNNNYYQLVTNQNDFELGNLSNFITTLNLTTIAGYSLPLFSNQIYQFTNFTETNNNFSFNVSFAGINSTSSISIPNLNNNLANNDMMNSIITYLNNHQTYLYKYMAYYGGITIKKNQANFASNFDELVSAFISNNISLPVFSSIFVSNNNGSISITEVEGDLIFYSTNNFNFSLTKYQQFLQSQVNQVASYINSLNSTQLGINKWLVATNNATYQNGKWTFTNLNTYLKILFEYSSLFNYFYAGYQFADVKQTNNEISFAINLDGFISNITVNIALTPNDLSVQAQANSIINYLSNHENELLAGLIGNGGFNAINNQLAINDSMLSAINNWLADFYNSFANVKLIVKGTTIYAQINNVTSTIGYQFPLSKLTTILQAAANQLVTNIQNNYLGSLESWLLSNGDLTETNGVWTLSDLGSFLNSQGATSTGIKNGTYTYPMPYNFTNQNCTFGTATVVNNNITFTVSIYGISSTIQLQIPVPNSN